MSKSYGKYKTCGICYGINTPYYKDPYYATKNNKIKK